MRLAVAITLIIFAIMAGTSVGPNAANAPGATVQLAAQNG
jgi:hypothetical protein